MLPPSPTLVVALPSLDAFDRALDTVVADSSQGPVLTPKQRTEMDPRKLLDKALPGLADLVDPGKPLALALVAPPPMGQDPVATLVVPLQDAGATIPPLQDDFRSQALTGSYLAISTAATITVQDTVPALSRNLEPGAVSAALDLAGLLNQYRGLIDMSPGHDGHGAPARPGQPGRQPDRPGSGRGPGPGRPDAHDHGRGDPAGHGRRRGGP